ncbi:MAG: calcium-binding protein [Planctomycetota bacterium]|nr:calcium-binding protein [Planctomycetota bacterium]
MTTLQDVIDRLNAYGESITVTVNNAGTGLVISDSRLGPGNLTIQSLNGSFAAADLGILGTGSGAVINGTSLVAGSLRLDGRSDADVLRGSSGDDILITGGGGDVLLAGAGLDTVVATRDANMTLTNAALQFGSGDSASLDGIEQARLSGGDSANVIDASAFSLGPVTLLGGAGNDILTGGSGNDLLSGGDGLDVLDGRAGTDSLAELGSRIVLDSLGNGLGGNGTLDLAEGTEEVVRITLDAGVTGGGFRVTFNGETTNAIPFDATSFDLKSELAQLAGLDHEDLIVSRDPQGGPFVVRFVNTKGGLNVPDLTAASVDLVGGGVTATVTTQGAVLLNPFVSIESATLYGTAGHDVIDASRFSGTTSIWGFWGNDILIGGSGADRIEGGNDDDRITGGGGADLIDGGTGIDTIIESRDVNFTLTNTALTASGGVLGGVVEVDALANFEWAVITGGDSANTIDLSAFTGLNADTSLALLNGGNGFGATSGEKLALIGGSVSVGVSIAENRIDNRVNAYIDRADSLSTTSGDISLSATEQEIVRANTFSAAGALGITIGGAISSATTDARNTLTSVVFAGINRSDVTSANDIAVTAAERSSIDATIQAVSIVSARSFDVAATLTRLARVLGDVPTISPKTSALVTGATVVAGLLTLTFSTSPTPTDSSRVCPSLVSEIESCGRWHPRYLDCRAVSLVFQTQSGPVYRDVYRPCVREGIEKPEGVCGEEVAIHAGNAANVN